MKKTVLGLTMAALIGITSAFTPIVTKYVTKAGHISFYSHTTVEDISANNYKVVSTIDIASGDVVFSVPMQSFEFEKELMQKHYNSSKFLDTKKFPKAKLKGKITNLSEINFSKDGTYKAIVSGELELHGVTKPVENTGTITVKASVISVDTKLQITLADYDVAFKDGKPSTNIAKTIEATVKAEYQVAE